MPSFAADGGGFRGWIGAWGSAAHPLCGWSVVCGPFCWVPFAQRAAGSRHAAACLTDEASEY